MNLSVHVRNTEANMRVQVRNTQAYHVTKRHKMMFMFELYRLTTNQACFVSSSDLSTCGSTLVKKLKTCRVLLSSFAENRLKICSAIRCWLKDRCSLSLHARTPTQILLILSHTENRHRHSNDLERLATSRWMHLLKKSLHCAESPVSADQIIGQLSVMNFGSLTRGYLWQCP